MLEGSSLQYVDPKVTSEELWDVFRLQFLCEFFIDLFFFFKENL